MTTQECSGLMKYAKKRDFENTPEPRPELFSKKNIKNVKLNVDQTTKISAAFVIQEHHSRNLHYDFRIEIDGVLKSWVVPKDVPTKVGEKRLAIPTEDHPLAYKDFEGTIPDGEYGAGVVKIWEYGTYDLIINDGAHWKMEDAVLAYEKGKLSIELFGKNGRISGKYAIFRMGDKAGNDSQGSNQLEQNKLSRMKKENESTKNTWLIMKIYE